MADVVVVDDSLFMRGLLKGIVTRMGHSVVAEAARGDEGVDLYSKFSPDIVLSDIVIPSGEYEDGIGVLEAILGADPSGSVIMCSALGNKERIFRAFKSGAKGFITKPFHEDQVREVVSSCLDLDILNELGNIGAGNASTAFSQMLSETVILELPTIQIAPYHIIPLLFGANDETVTAVYMPLKGGEMCDIVFALDIEEAEKIATMMNMAESPDEVDPEMARSAIEELGNILICSFLNAISDFTGVELVPEPPILVTDSFDAILNTILSMHAIGSETTMIFESVLKRSSTLIKSYLLMFPRGDLQRKLVEKGKEWLM